VTLARQIGKDAQQYVHDQQQHASTPQRDARKTEVSDAQQRVHDHREKHNIEEISICH
jgi:hypothetical protein